jgi:hypothetical protein
VAFGVNPIGTRYVMRIENGRSGSYADRPKHTSIDNTTHRMTDHGCIQQD